MNQTKHPSTLRLYTGRNHSRAAGLARGLLLATGILGLLSLTLPAPAQTFMTQKPFRVRVEVPTAFNGTVLLTNWNLRVPTNGATGVDGFQTNWLIASVNMSISGAPAGCTASIVGSDSTTPVTTIPVNLNTNNAALNTNLYIKLVFDGTEAGGTSTVTVDASGAGLPDDPFLLPVDVAKIWNGSGNAAVTGPGSFSDGTQWLGTGAPAQGDNVIFTDVGTQTNSLVGFGTGTTNFLTNVVINSSMAIASLRFCQTNNTTNYDNIMISPGVTLGIGGNFSILRDYTYWSIGPMRVSIFGTNGTLIQTNESASFSILSDAQQNSLVDMSGLSMLQLDVNQLHLSDYMGYPNYPDLVYTNNYSNTTAGQGKPQRFYQTWRMANTNFIKATFVDPNNYTNSLTRDYALVLGRNEASGGGSGQDDEMLMGFTNVFNLDGMCVAGSFSLGADLRFLNSGSFAKFRNVDGVSRMSIFATADAGGGGTNLWGTTLGDNTKCGGNGTGVDFSRGTVDMLVDRLYLSLDRSNVTASGKGISQSSGFAIASGTVDANTAILGYQSQGDQTNQSYAYAQMYVSNSAVFKVNKTLALGYATASIGSPNAENNGHGQLSIGPGGTVCANNITVGGVTKASTGNNITMTSGASLVVSNTIADATSGGALGTLSFGGTGNCSLTLFLNGANPMTSLVYLTNLTASGTGNKLIIGGVENLTYPVDVPLITGVGPTIAASVFDAGVSMPVGSGLTGTLQYSSASNTIYITIINRVGHHLLWRAAGSSGTWDYTTKNWLDQDTGITATNYENPDVVAFDDAAGIATNISIGGATGFTPTAVNVTNNNNYYTFTDGGNQILGGPPLNKYGSGTVEVDGNTTLSAQVNQGVLVGTGSIGGANVASGATMNYSGTLGGSLTSAGTATSSGSIAGSLTVQPGGVVTNSGTLANPFAVQTNGLLFNSGTMNNIGTGSVGSPQVAAGGILINGGTIGANLGGQILYVSGTFEDLGVSGITLQSVTVGPGGTFIPAGGNIGTTTITSDGTGNFPGAALLTQGSTTVFEVNPVTPANTVLSTAHTSFGASAGAQTQNGCTLVISNTTATPFSAGQTFQLFGNSLGGSAIFNTGSSTNTFPVIIPATPGPGLVWDLRNLWIPNQSGANGIIGVVSALSGPTLTNSFTVTSSNIVAQFSWDQSALGMSLEQLISQGITSSNWTRIAGSWTNTSVTLTNDPGNNVYYRLSFP